MNFRSTVLLLLVLAGLGGFVWFYESKIPTAEEKAAAEQRLIVFNPGEVTRLQIKLGNSLTACVKNQNGWQLIHPLKAAADPEKIQEILEALARARLQRSVELKESPGEPRAELTLWAQDRPISLKFGENTPLGRNLYVKIEGRSDWRVVSADLFGKVIRNADDLRDRRIFTFALQEVKGCEVVSSKGIAKIEQKNGEWRSQAGPCDRQKVESYLYRLQGLRALDFLPADEMKKPMGLEKPQVKITVSMEKGKPAMLSLGAVKDKTVSLYAGGGVQKEPFALSLQEKDSLIVTADDFK